MNLSLKIKKVLNTYRLLVYLVGFVLLLSISAIIFDDKLRNIDLYTYKALYFNSDYNDFNSNQISIIDLPPISKEKPTDYRKRIVELLDTIYQLSMTLNPGERPNIILDFAFMENGEEDSDFIETINKLKADVINVYGVYDVVVSNDGLNWQMNENNRDVELYDKFSKGRLHTRVNVNCTGIIWYDSYLKFEDSINNSNKLITALPLKVVKPKEIFTNKDVQTFVLPYGSQENLKAHTWIYKPVKDSTNVTNKLLPIKNSDNEFDVRNQYIIIGDFINDKVTINEETIIPGSYLVAWAIFGQINNELSKQPINNPLLQFIIVLFGVGVILLVFNFIFKQFKKLQTKLILIAAISFLFGLIVLFIIVYFFTPENKIIRPSFPALSMFLTSIFIWQYKKIYIKRGLIEGNKTYDVFISYSRSQTKWVKNNLYNSLKGFRNSEDKKINIFFDEESIPEGELFHSYYRDAIINSKLFLPIFSEDYFNKNHCMEELKLALFRVTETKGSDNELKIYPLAFNIDKVPAQYRDRNITLIDDENTFMKKLKETLYKS